MFFVEFTLKRLIIIKIILLIYKGLKDVNNYVKLK